MNNYNRIIQKLHTETVYLLNSFEGVVMKLLPGENAPIFAKFPGRQEYRISHNANLFADTLREANEITQEQYEKY